MSRRIDLNVDIGEGFPHDRDLLRFASSANICCGEHAGSWERTLETIELCRSAGVRIGMHPGFPDRENMGRTMPDVDRREFSQSLIEQAVRFMTAIDAAYIKPHGAWYNGLFTASPRFTDALEAILERYPLQLMALPVGSIAERFADRLIREGFADRGYRPDGTLIPRTEPGAILHDPNVIAAQVMFLAERVDSICLHGDTPGCLEFAENVYRTLADAGWEVGV